MPQAKDVDIAASLFAGEGEMGALMRSHDWAKTPLGPIEQWPQSLRTTVSILLNSRYPMFTFWGPKLVKLYNDSYRPILGDKHPWALGRPGPEIWPEIWDAIGPLVDQVITRGEATWSDNLPLFMHRSGYLEETYFTFSYSPVRDESGGVGGVFCACTETTQQVLGDRRLRTLRDLAARAGEAKTAANACQSAMQTMASNPADIPFALLYLLDGDGRTATLAGTTGLDPGGAASPAVVNLGATSTAPWPLAEVAQTARSTFVADVVERVGALTVGPWPEPPHAALVLPVASPGQTSPTGLLVAGISPRLLLDDDYQGFLELVAGQVAAAIADARAYETERQRAEALAEIDQAKTIFFSNVSHEFRTPLTLMLAPIEDMLADGEHPLPPLQRDRLEIAQRNSLRLLKLVNTLLDFSRIEAGRIQALYRPTDLATYTAELASTFRSLIERADLTLVVDCPPLPEPVYVDREMWEKIVLNLLSNAFKYTLAGEIRVSLRMAAGEGEEGGEGEGGRGGEGGKGGEGGEEGEGGEGGEGGEESENSKFKLQNSNLSTPSAPSPLSPLSSPSLHHPITPHPPYALLEIRDTGIGIPPEERSRLFERFHRVRGAQGRSFEGTGIGLSLVQELAKLHGGGIEVTSTVGEGSCFRVWVPMGCAHLPSERIPADTAEGSVAAPSPATDQGRAFLEEAWRWLPETALADEAGRPDSAARESVTSSPMPPLEALPRAAHILLADDNADMRAYVKRLLLEQRYTVDVAADGVAALEAIGRRRPDLVLTDVMMPRLDGFGLLHTLRADPQTRELPIILLSARAGEAARIEGLGAGADDYLIKPFSIRELLARVEACLKLATMRRESAQREHQLRTAAEAAQQQAEALSARLIQVLESMGDGFVSLDREWRITYQNAVGEAINNGKPRSQVLGKTHWEEWPASVGSDLEINYRRAMAEQVAIRFETHYVEPPDHDLWLEINAYPSPDALNLFYRDISDRKRTELALQEREEVLRLFVKYVPSGVAMFDRQMRYLMASQRWIDDYGLGGVETLVGRSHYDLFPEISARWRQIHERCLAGATEKCEADCFERLDGSSQWIRWEVRPWYQINQAIGGIVIFAEDITDRKRFEASLQSQQEQLQQQLAEIETIYQSAPIGLNVLDRELRFVRVNQRLAEMNGLSAEAHLGRTIRELLPNLADQAEAMLHPILETGEPLLNVEISGETPAQPGVQRTWVESFWPLKDGDRIIGISTVCEEVTDRKRIEAERQQALDDLSLAKAELEQRVAERTAELSAINTDLSQRKAVLRSLFNSSTMPMGVVELYDDDILYISSNGATAAFLGVPPQAVPNRFASELGASATTIEHWSAHYREAERTQAPVRFDYYQEQGPGRGRWLAGSVCAVEGGPSGYPRFSYILEDITERKQAQETLARREEQLRLTLEFTHIGTWDWDVRQNTVIWNDNHFRLLGLDPTATADPYQSWRQAIHPDDLDRVEQALQDALHQHTDYETEYRVFYPDGTMRWLVGRGRGLYDADQQPVRMLGVILDISDRKQAEQIQEFQAVITRNMAEGICVVRADNAMIAYANRKFEQMFGYDPGELDGQHVSIVNYATEEVSAEDVNQAIRSAVLANQEATYEVHNVKKDGTPFWCSATTSIFEHPEYGSVLVAVQQDISDRKESQEKLQASLKEKELLLKEVYHRVKNNLQVIYSLLNLQSRNVSDPGALSVLRDSQSRVRAMALVHEKLYKSPDLTRIDLADYIHSLAYSLLDTYRSDGNHISLRLEIEPYSLDIETALPCGLMLTELISNSLKYAFSEGQPGEITITFALGPHQVSLRVGDNGIGLPDDFDLERVSSLGISLVRNLAQQIKGDVAILPQPVGSAFEISFPL